MFDNIKSLNLTKDPQDAAITTGMISSEGEFMEFRYSGNDYTHLKNFICFNVSLFSSN